MDMRNEQAITRKGITMSTQKRAQDAYYMRIEDVQTLLFKIQLRLKEHNPQSKNKVINWAHVGDLGHVAEKLKEIVEFMGS